MSDRDPFESVGTGVGAPQHQRFGPVGSSAWRLLGTLDGILDNQADPTVSPAADRREFILPKSGSTKVVWMVAAPDTVDSFDIAFWRFVQVTQGETQKVVAEVARFDRKVAITNDGTDDLLFEVDHYGDPVVAVIDNIVLGTGSLPLAAGEGLSLFFKSK